MQFGRSCCSSCSVRGGLILPRTATADEWDKRTILTFSQAIEVPGKVLPAGTYVLQLVDWRQAGITFPNTAGRRAI